MKVCLNKSCTFVHLAGTRRSGDPRQWNDQERRSDPPVEFDHRRSYTRNDEERRSDPPVEFDRRRSYTQSRNDDHRRELSRSRDDRRGYEQIRRPQPWSSQSDREPEKQTANEISEKRNDEMKTFLEKYLEKMKVEIRNENTLLNQQIQQSLQQQIQQSLSAIHQQVNNRPQMHQPQIVYPLPATC